MQKIQVIDLLMNLIYVLDGSSKGIIPSSTTSLLFRLLTPGCKISRVYAQRTLAGTIHAFSVDDASFENTGRTNFNSIYLRSIFIEFHCTLFLFVIHYYRIRKIVYVEVIFLLDSLCIKIIFQSLSYIIGC